MWSDWLVFFDCGFQSVCPLMEKEKRLMEASWWERLTEGETGSSSIGQRHAHKYLIQFSAVGWGQTMVEVMKIMATPLKGPRHALLYSVPPDPAAGHHRPTPPMETPEHSQASLGQSLVGSLLLSSGSWCVQCSVCACLESISPVLCKLWQLYGGVNGNVLQERKMQSEL